MSKKKDKGRKGYSETGRPSLWSQEVCDEICNLIATTPDSLVRILTNNPHLPAYRTLLTWLSSKDSKFLPFQRNYARSREDKADFMAEHMTDLVQDAQQDILTRKIPNFKAGAYMQAVRMHVDVMKFHAMKMKPKVYGDKLDVTSKGNEIKSHVSWIGHHAADAAKKSKEENKEEGNTEPAKQ